ncbi:MAG: hypothetical protein JNL21_41065 [Myxococcales bacterium]|nr:hypothetical protein [Myxococcales bacterium]
MIRSLVLAGLAAAIWLGVALPCRADEPSVHFERATRAIAAKDAQKAIVELETLADRGFAHPDVAYNRGLAYALRAKASGQPGDLGRAAAGFEEALRLRPEDRDAAHALDLVRAEVTRRRSKQDKSDRIVRPSLDRVLLRLLSPAVWAGLAMAASVAFATGLLLRRRPTGLVHVAGSVLAWLMFVALLGLVPLAFGSSWLERARGAAVVVAPALTLRDSSGKAVGDAPEVPEAALVELGDSREGQVLVRWGSYEGWVPRETVRPLPR